MPGCGHFDSQRHAVHLQYDRRCSHHLGLSLCVGIGEGGTQTDIVQVAVCQQTFHIDGKRIACLFAAGSHRTAAHLRPVRTVVATLYDERTIAGHRLLCRCSRNDMRSVQTQWNIEVVAILHQILDACAAVG